MKAARFPSMAAVERWLAEHTDFEKMARFAYHERAFNLDRTRNLLAALGDPQNSFKIAHVAGTKGKGSVSHILSSILSAAGKRPGLFTSPHLVSILERVRLDGKPAKPEWFCRDMESVAEACEEVAAQFDDSPTFFETTLAVSALHHCRESVTRAVYEVGLGGRLDATNVLSPDVCVITRLGLDHTHVLGNTIELIAAEKAGIIKRGVPVVAAASSPEALEIVEKTARGLGAPLFVEGREIRWKARKRPGAGPGLLVDVDAPGISLRGASLPLAGFHQGGNAALAVAAARLFADSTGDELPLEAVRQGLACARIPGRLDQVSSDPQVIVDVAHNEVSMAAAVKALDDFWPGAKITALFGLSADKDARSILARLCPACSKIVFTTAGTARSADPGALEAIASELGFKAGLVEPDFDEALGKFLDMIGPNGTGLVTGSFFVAGRAMKSLVCRRGEPAI